MVTTLVEPLNIRAELKLIDPPTSRDRDIFEQVAVMRRGQDDVADEYSLTQAPRLADRRPREAMADGGHR